jgi:hypothetical protein
MNVLINITSYNRKEKLANLLEQLDGYNFIVWDDKSDFKINHQNFIQFNQNYGKRHAWKKFKIIFDYLKTTNYDYYIFLPDDVVLYDGFVEEAVRLWDSIEDDKKASLSVGDVKRTYTPNWTGFKSEPFGEVIKTQWNDLMFICDKNFFNIFALDMISFKRFKHNPLISSGVGRQISLKLYRDGWNMYNTSKNLLKHVGNDDSKMNPEIRKSQPL